MTVDVDHCPVVINHRGRQPGDLRCRCNVERVAEIECVRPGRADGRRFIVVAKSDLPGAGAPVVVVLSPEVQLGNQGGIITLLDTHGLKVHGVSYTKEQAQREGWTIVF